MIDKATLSDIYFKTGLYTKINGEQEWKSVIEAIKWDEDVYDAFCPHCEAMSIFKALKNNELSGMTKQPTGPRHMYRIINRDININASADPLHGGSTQFHKTLQCSRCNNTIASFYISTNEETYKVGMFPSLADMEIATLISEISLPKSRIPKELNKAVGLRSHGAHIGAFAYLRRVYEGLIIQAESKAKEQKDWDAEAFRMMRAQEKIKALEGYLPDEMIKHRSAYGILSKGIHELSEEECEKSFLVVWSLIVLILEDIEAKRKSEKRRHDLQEALKKQ